MRDFLLSRQNQGEGRQAFTLVEVLVAMAVLSLLVVMLATFAASLWLLGRDFMLRP